MSYNFYLLLFQRGPGTAATFGMPTRDTHPLIDEEGSVDRPLPTQYTRSPLHAGPAKKESKTNIPPTIKEGMGDTFTRPPTKRNSWLQVDLGMYLWIVFL